MVTFTEHSGDSPADAVKILGAKDSIEGVQAEYKYITERFGAWKLKIQALHRPDKDGRRIDNVYDLKL